VIFFKNIDYTQERKVCLWLLIATAVTGIIGISFKDFFQNLFNPLFAASMIAMTGFILYVSDKFKDTYLKIHELNTKKSILIGLGQAIAIIPGISRSGTTITFALLTGMERKHAATFSFLLSVPAILGANVSEFKTFISLDTSQLAIYLTGFVAAFISGYFVISWLMKLIVKAKLRYFSYYCWVVASVCMVILLMEIL
jgi:undecaprenyl-diphosphatase